MSRRLEIIRRATEIFARKGFAETALQDIADASGIRREALYYHFKDKAEILYSIISPASVVLRENLALILASAMPTPGKLRAAIANHLRQFNPNYLEMVVAYRALLLRQAEFAELRKTWKQYESLWLELLRQAQRDGDIDPTLDAKVLAFSILGMCNSLSSWYDPEGEQPLDAIIETHFRVLWNGLAPPRPGADVDSGTAPAKEAI